MGYKIEEAAIIELRPLCVYQKTFYGFTISIFMLTSPWGLSALLRGA